MLEQCSVICALIINYSDYLYILKCASGKVMILEHKGV